MENCTSIWLPSLIERYEIIKTLEKNIKQPIYIFNAIDGTKHKDKYMDYSHILKGQSINPGIIGCSLSHLEILKNMNTDAIVIFEDDCTFHGDLVELNNFIKNAPDFDILWLGYHGKNIRKQVNNICDIPGDKLYGLFGYIINKKAYLNFKI